MTKRNLIKHNTKTMLLLFVFVCFLIACSHINASIKSEIPCAVLLQEDFYDITSQKAQLSNSNFDVQAEELATISAPLRSSEVVRMIATTTRAANNLKIIWGSFYQENAVLEQRPYIVISENLFSRLFSGYGANEYVVLINGTEYNLSGVYQSSKGFLADISNDGIEIAYTSRSPSGNVHASRVLLYGEQSPDALKHNFSKEMQLSTNATMHDIRLAHKLSAFLNSAVAFLCTCCLLWYALKKSHSTFMHCYSNSQALSTKLLIARILQAAVIIVAACLVFWLSLRQLSVPPSLLPAENIFDLSHYAQLITKFYQGLHALNYTPMSFAANLLWLQLCCAVFAVISFWLLITSLKPMILFLQQWFIDKLKTKS